MALPLQNLWRKDADFFGAQEAANEYRLGYGNLHGGASHPGTGSGQPQLGQFQHGGLQAGAVQQLAGYPPEHSLTGHPEAANYVDVRSRDFNQGGIHETGRETDLAIQGPGFFKVQTPRGLRYTRNGSFHLSSDFELITKEGYLVLGKDGPITLDSRDKQFGIDSEGGIHLDKNLADRVHVVDFPNPQDLRADGQTYLVPGPLAGEAMESIDARIHQGSIEESNVDLVAESVALVDIHRRYESYLKVLETFAASDRKVVEEIGQQA